MDEIKRYPGSSTSCPTSPTTSPTTSVALKLQVSSREDALLEEKLVSCHVIRDMVTWVIFKYGHVTMHAQTWLFWYILY